MWDCPECGCRAISDSVLVCPQRRCQKPKPVAAPGTPYIEAGDEPDAGLRADEEGGLGEPGPVKTGGGGGSGVNPDAKVAVT